MAFYRMTMVSGLSFITSPPKLKQYRLLSLVSPAFASPTERVLLDESPSLRFLSYLSCSDGLLIHILIIRITCISFRIFFAALARLSFTNGADSA